MNTDPVPVALLFAAVVVMAIAIVVLIVDNRRARRELAARPPTSTTVGTMLGRPWLRPGDIVRVGDERYRAVDIQDTAVRLVPLVAKRFDPPTIDEVATMTEADEAYARDRESSAPVIQTAGRLADLEERIYSVRAQRALDRGHPGIAHWDGRVHVECPRCRTWNRLTFENVAWCIACERTYDLAEVVGDHA